MLYDPLNQYPTAEAEPNVTPPAGAGTSTTPQPTPTFDMTKSGLPQDVPLYPGANGIQAVNGMGISFQTNDSLDQVNSFYTGALKSGGWQLVKNNAIAAIVSQTWLKGKTFLNLSIQDQGDHRMVLIMAPAKP
jgi:hypothetical protein